MAKFWTRLRRWIRTKPQKGAAPRASKAQSEPHIGTLLERLGDNNSLTSQRALAPSTLIAPSNDTPKVVQKQGSTSLAGARNSDSILLGWPEFQHAKKQRQNLDKAVPQELQQSKTSSSLHDLTISAQAGTRPYSEDVADRNISSSESLPLSTRSGYSTQRALLNVNSRGARKAGKPPCSYLTQNKNIEANHRLKAQAHAHDSRIQQLSADDVALVRGQSEPANIHLADAIEERRHSLPHKPDIFNLRNAVEAEVEQVASRTTSPRRARSGSDSSRRSSMTRARLNAPLPSIPLPRSRTYQQLEGESDHDRKQFRKDSKLDTNETQVNEHPSTLFGGSVDTTVCERWAPAVTHETIERITHEIREEHIHREVHNYHYRHTVQPVVEYEIAAPRHYVREGDCLREIDEKDIPTGAPSADWYASEVASQLDALSVEDVPWEVNSDPGVRRFQTAESFDGASDARSRSSRISMATFKALLDAPMRSRRAVRAIREEGSPTPKARRRREARQSAPVPVILPW